MEVCGNPVKCWDFLVRTCLREKGHPGGCNPFSNIPESGIKTGTSREEK